MSDKTKFILLLGFVAVFLLSPRSYGRSHSLLDTFRENTYTAGALTCGHTARTVRGKNVSPNFIVESVSWEKGGLSQHFNPMYSAEILNVSSAPENAPARTIPDDLVIPISEDELMKKVRIALSAAGGEPASIKKILVDDLGPVYVARFSRKSKSAFARIVARRNPCMDCHDVFFVYSFDDQGAFLDFVPIHITKRHNRAWDAEDVQKIRGRFLGKSILKPLEFRPQVDGVTSATISSRVVFHSLGRTSLVYEKLIELGYITEKKK